MEGEKIIITVDNEQREYDTSTFSDAAIQKVNELKLANNVIQTRSIEFGLLQLGRQVLEGQLSQHLPKTGFTVVQQDDSKVESNTSDTKEES
jgi:hypothetical protein